MYSYTKSVSNLSDLETYRKEAPELLDEDSASKFLGVSIPTLRKATEEQGLPAKLIGDRKRLYTKTAILKWVTDNDD